MEGNGSIFPAEERWNTLGQELGPSTTFGRIPRTTLKIAILKPQVADVWFSMIGAYGWGCGNESSRWAQSVARRLQER